MIKNATSSLIIDSNANYIPNAAINNGASGDNGTNTGTTSGYGGNSGVKTSTTQVRDNLINSGAISSNNTIGGGTAELLPVTSNQEEIGLSVSGVIKFTNLQRMKNNVPALNLSPELNASAQEKLQDMFDKQYFQHISPSGESVSSVAKRNGYDYIVVGENLALGIFAGDDQVVAAWMASPGHKKNILDTRYQDVGIAVGQGMYQGRRQWLIVQHFGKPLSSCTSPSETMKKEIEIQKNNITVLESEITKQRALVDQSSGTAYTDNATKYNALVTDYNQKLDNLKADIEKYNEIVKNFNNCAGII